MDLDVLYGPENNAWLDCEHEQEFDMARSIALEYVDAQDYDESQLIRTAGFIWNCAWGSPAFVFDGVVDVTEMLFAVSEDLFGRKNIHTRHLKLCGMKFIEQHDELIACFSDCLLNDELPSDGVHMQMVREQIFSRLVETREFKRCASIFRDAASDAASLNSDPAQWDLRKKLRQLHALSRIAKMDQNADPADKRSQAKRFLLEWAVLGKPWRKCGEMMSRYNVDEDEIDSEYKILLDD